MTDVSAAEAAHGGKVDVSRRGSPPHHRDQREAMTTNAVTVTRARTGGPREDGPKILEHVMGWTLVVVLAMFVTQLGLL
ncbi:hypothetical protein GCM10010415_34240 [Streptomyces atrovirens]